jgi:hypothetical protein
MEAQSYWKRGKRHHASINAPTPLIGYFEHPFLKGFTTILNSILAQRSSVRQKNL